MAVEGSLVFRAATPADRAGTLEIGDVFEGCDYLPEMFDALVTDPRYRSFVCDAGGCIVAFRFYRILSGGKAIYAGGIRTHSEFRGKNISARLGKFCVEELSREFDAGIFLKTYFTAFESAYQYNKIDSSPEEYTLVTKRKFKNVRASASNIRSFLEQYKSKHRIEHLSEERSTSTVLTEPTRSAFFPDDHMMVGWQLFPLTEENIVDIFRERSCSWSLNADRCPVWLSIHEAFECPAGLRVGIDMWGVDQRHIADHVAKGLACAMDKKPAFSGQVEVLLYAETKHDLEDYATPFESTPGGLSDNKISLCIRRRIIIV